MKQSQTSVLLVEDNLGDARLVQAYLDDAGGERFALTHVGTIGEAELALSKAEFDAVVLDLSLPDGHGLEAVRRTMSFSAPGKSLVVLTGNDDDALALEALDAGAQDYLVKGDVTTKELVRSLRYSIERKRALFAKETAEYALRDALSATERRVEERTNELTSANERLRESEERFRQLAENINEVFWLHDISANEVVYVSPAFERVWKARIEDLHAHSLMWMNSIDPEDRDRVASSWTKALTVGTFDQEYRIIRPNGRTRWIRDRGFPIRNDAGRLVRIAGIAEDITEQKELATEWERAKEAAESASRTKSEFLATISHELRTPLNGIVGSLDLLDTTQLNSKQRRVIELARDSADSLLVLINDILDISKIEAGRIEIENIDFDLREVVENLMHCFAQRAEQQAVQLMCHIPITVPTLVCGDPVRIKQLLTNLISNAIKFTRDGEVAVNLTVEEETADRALLKFTVTDSGIGIPSGKLEQLFAPFVQADSTTTRRFGGTGLGLSISKQLTELMGGRIGASSEPGRGSTFWFTLDLKKQPVAAASPVLPAKLQHIRVMAVDDNATNREILHEQFQVFGMEHEIVADGHQALQRLREAVTAGTPFTLAVLDMQMPGMDGEQLAGKIKADPDLEETILVLLTSIGDLDNTLRWRSAGFAACCAKPITTKQLLESIVDAMACSRNQFEITGIDSTVRPLPALGALETEAGKPDSYVSDPAPHSAAAVESKPFPFRPCDVESAEAVQPTNLDTENDRIGDDSRPRDGLLNRLGDFLGRVAANRPLSRRRLAILLGLWAGALGAGFANLEMYANTPGDTGVVPSHWPAETALQQSNDRPTLIMFVHPRCPCTRASAEELARLLARSRGLADVYAVFVRPSGVSKNWEKAGLWSTFSNIPDASLVVDESGEEARKFGAMTSGEVHLYDVGGQLLFQGGITGARGHSGDNAGRAAVYSWLRWKSATTHRTFVFGCPLFESETRCESGLCGCQQ